MSDNLLDRILLSPRVVAEYHGFAREIAKQLSDVHPATVPDEQARVLDNGSLEIFVFINGKKYSFVVEKDDWAYM